MAVSNGSIVGSWYIANPGGGTDQIVFTFLAGGAFLVADKGTVANDPNGTSGLEAGTYTWDSATGALSLNFATNTDGQWGLSHSGITTATVVDDVLTFTGPEGPFAVPRLTSPAATSIVGSWYETSGNEQFVYTFLADGTYLCSSNGDRLIDADGQRGIEWGTYAWNAATGAFSFQAQVDTDGVWGFSGEPVTTVVVGGDVLTLSSSTDSYPLTRLSPVAASTITGTAGGDSLTGTSGSDTIIGLGGIDTVTYSGAKAGYTLAKTGTGFTVSGEGTDALTGVERLQFSDRKVALDLDGNAGNVARILGAVFGREAVANKEYVGIGLSYLDGGMSYEALMALAIDVRLGGVSTTAVVNLLWGNVIGGTPSASDLATFTGMLQGGTSAGALGVLAANTPFNEANIGLVGLMQTGIEFI